MAPKPGTITVDPESLAPPAERFKTVAGDMSALHDEAGQQSDDAGTASGNATVAGACDVFKSAIQAATKALATDTGIFGDNLQKAGAAYTNTDKDAYRIHRLQLTTREGGTPGVDSSDTYVDGPGGDN